MAAANDRGTRFLNVGDANILMCQKRNVVVHCVHNSVDASGNICANVSGTSNVLFKASNGHSLQTFNKAGSSGDALTITSVTYSLTGVATISREFDGKKGDHANVLVLGTGQGSFDYAGYGIECGNANVKVKFTGTSEGFVTIGLSKGSSFEDPDLQQLQARDRIPF